MPHLTPLPIHAPSLGTYLTWAPLLVAQNIAFTFVSRARNSGSLSRHLSAAVLSNGIWFLTQIMTLEAMTAILTGALGLRMAITVGVFYTVFTIVGSLIGHAVSLQGEKGHAAVGANRKYAQVPVADWERVQTLLAVMPTNIADLHTLSDIVREYKARTEQVVTQITPRSWGTLDA